MKPKFLFVLIISAIIFHSCKKENNKIVFEKTKDGLQYYFVEENPSNPKPQKNDGVVIAVRIIGKDSVIFESKNFTIPVNKPYYSASIDEALLMMHKGDSAIFKIDAYDFFKYNADKTPMPDFLQKGDSLTFYIRLKKILTQKEIEKEKKRLARLQMLKESQMITDFIVQNNWQVEPFPSGLYMLVIKEGNGAKPQRGDSVYFNYTVWLLNGDKIDSSFDKGKPLGAKMGDGKLFMGVEEALYRMKQGTKAKLLLPSYLALGDKGIPDLVPPYSPLLFEIELVKVKKN